MASDATFSELRDVLPNKRTKTAAVLLLTFLLAVGGGSGLGNVISAVRGPSSASQTCASYWEDIGQLKRDGFEGFSLMQSSDELSMRCGQPSDVAGQWKQ